MKTTTVRDIDGYSEFHVTGPYRDIVGLDVVSILGSNPSANLTIEEALKLGQALIEAAGGADAAPVQG